MFYINSWGESAGMTTITRAINHRVIFFVVALTLLSGGFGSAMAHSTKSRIKVTLEKEMIGIDDVAYFAESYVHRHMYNDNTEGTKDRYYIKDFKGLDQNGGKAELRFVVLDKKNNSSFDGSMSIERGLNGVWRFTGKNGVEPVDVTTYVPKGKYYWEKYSVGISAAGIFFCLCVLSYSLYQRKIQRSLDEDSDGDGDGDVKGEMNEAV